MKKTVKIRTRVKLEIDVDIEVDFDRENSEAIIVGGDIAPTFRVRSRALNEALTPGDFKKLDREARDTILKQSLSEWREHVNNHPSCYPTDGVRTIPLPLNSWADIMNKESGLHRRIHVAGVVAYLKNFDILVEPALERDASLYIWEVRPGSGEFDKVEEHISSQLQGAETERMDEGSMRVYWKKRN